MSRTREIRKRLRELAKLPANWDSYGALPVSQEALKKAEMILLNCPSITPSPSGSVTLEWNLGDGAFYTQEIE